MCIYIYYICAIVSSGYYRIQGTDTAKIHQHIHIARGQTEIHCTRIHHYTCIATEEILELQSVKSMPCS